MSKYVFIGVMELIISLTKDGLINHKSSIKFKNINITTNDYSIHLCN